ncbi:MAG TPA: DUF2298 domain-containing protein [Anaerolineae bacterium]|nr:DUF2298 domain-containing protein [Anaerolineae bacterium]
MTLIDIWAAIRWWFVLTTLGLLVFPTSYYLFSRLPDRGYAFTKMLALLLVSYLFWLLGSLGFLTNSNGSILLSVAITAALSLRAHQLAPDWRSWLRHNRRYVLGAELLFFLAFIFWAWVRAQHPAISATEKPMEFAFLNAATYTPTFPPLDPWLSGFGISYYYFGYIMMSVIARLAIVPMSYAFNLSIAWIFAGTALGAFGLVHNLLTLDKNPTRTRLAPALALIAALAIPAAGNLEIFLELLYGQGIGHNITIGTDDAGNDQNFWQWLDVRDLDTVEPPSRPRYEGGGWWWWRSSRVINEYHLDGTVEAGLAPIAEFPAFSFILGDLHPHVLALPFAFLSLALALQWWLRPLILHVVAWQRSGLIDGTILLFRRLGPLTLLGTALIVGGLSFLNTWDVLIHLFIVVAAFVLAQWRHNGRWHASYLIQAILLGLALVFLAILLYLPFYLGFRSQAGAPYILPMLMRPTRLAHFLTIFGLPLIMIIPFIIMSAGQAIAQQRRRGAYLTLALGTTFGFPLLLMTIMLFMGLIIAITPEGANRLIALANRLELPLSLYAPGSPFLSNLIWAISSIFKLIPSLLLARLTWPGVTLLLGLTIGFALTTIAAHLNQDKPNQPSLQFTPQNNDDATDDHQIDRLLPFTLLLIITAAMLTIGPEFLYIRDNFGMRLNTIFKFYYQAWLLFGVAAVVGAGYLIEKHRAIGLIATPIYLIFFAISLLFPYHAIQSRQVEYRSMVGAAADESVATLNGLDYIRRTNPDEYSATLWLKQATKDQGRPVVLEAVGGQYSSYGRIAANTGLPTVLGWAGHEYQWRGSTPEPAERDPAVKAIYQDNDWFGTAQLLNKYNVQYIFVGDLERRTYGGQAVDDKFRPRLDIAFESGSVTIYRWQPQ